MNVVMNTSLKIRVKQANKLHHADKSKLFSLLKYHYPQMTLENIFESYDYLNNLYVFLVELDNRLIASRQVYYCPFRKMAPSWAQVIADTIGVRQFTIGSRAAVSPRFQNLGLGRQLINFSNQKSYQRFNVYTMLGSSTAPAAMKLYLNLGVNIWRPSLTGFANQPELALQRFLTRIKDSANDKARLTAPVRYVYSLDELEGLDENLVYHWRNQAVNLIEA